MKKKAVYANRREGAKPLLLCAKLHLNISNNNIVCVISAFGEGDVIQNVCDVLDETCSFCLMTPEPISCVMHHI